MLAGSKTATHSIWVLGVAGDAMEWRRSSAKCGTEGGKWNQGGSRRESIVTSLPNEQNSLQWMRYMAWLGDALGHHSSKQWDGEFECCFLIELLISRSKTHWSWLHYIVFWSYTRNAKLSVGNRTKCCVTKWIGWAIIYYHCLNKN